MFSGEEIPEAAPASQARIDLPSWDAPVPGEPLAALPPSAAPVLGAAPGGGPGRPGFPVLSRAELGVLGGLQVLLGLLHLGSGGILVSLVGEPVVMLTVESCYFFWGGLLFISSGSCSMVVEKNQNVCLMRGCMALNVTSVLTTVVGIVLVLWDLGICNELCYGAALQLELRVSRGLLGVLLMFTLLETCATLASTYLGWHIQLLASMQAAGVVPSVVPPPVVVLPPPPAYDEIFMDADGPATQSRDLET